MSTLPHILNSYWLWREVREKLDLSNPVYKYWKNTPNMKLNNKYVFVQKNCFPQKYQHIEPILTDLSGYLPIRYASDRLHVSEHIFSYDKMKLYKEFEYKYVQDVKFVNIKRFFMEYGIKMHKDAIVHLGQLKDLEITPSSTFYALRDDYGVVVYN